ncbi:Hypothetical predicted protein [Mytilus galloprovincialis]|uniref:Uncharacterized protein n=1 Tax=Mytilus galloprovincialis TaxID=29158 RepID=A0A8B6DZ07_MYTGA|nr:Hypothetical predicted protein [Mytilus galloprovincialis]
MGSACTKPNSKFIPFENDSDEVRIPPKEDGYPDPRYVYNITDKSLKRGATLFADPNHITGSETADRSRTLPMTKAELDKHARKTPKSALDSFDDLIAYLEKPLYGKASRDEVMVRSLLVWLSNQKISSFKSKKGRSDTPRGFLCLLGQDRSQSDMQILMHNGEAVSKMATVLHQMLGILWQRQSVYAVVRH